jgi:hypothetical protein
MSTIPRPFAVLVSLPVWALAFTPVAASPLQESDPPANAKVWIGREAEFEEYLKNAEVVRMEDIPVGVTKPQRCYLAPGGLCESISFKPIKRGRQHGFWESYEAEIASYELDKLLGMQMIPPTVEKRVKGNLGAAVLWVKPVKSFKELGGPPTPPPAHMETWNRQLVRAKMFDNLINNKDPNLGNWLVDPAWNLILIDHTRAFTGSKDMVHTLTRVDREFWERIKALSEEQLVQALEGWLDKGQIRDMLKRREIMQAEIEKLIAQKGEAAVFLP